MSDVPAAGHVGRGARRGAAAAGTRVRRSLTGALTGAALLIRPNLAPLGLVMAGMVVFAAHSPSRATTSIRAICSSDFGALGAFPRSSSCSLQNAMYGSPFTLGLRQPLALFTLDHIGPNLARYPAWLVDTRHAVRRSRSRRAVRRGGCPARSRAWWLLAFVLTTFGCYVAYTVYDAWWFLRFLLPAHSAAIRAGVSGRDDGGWLRLAPAPRLAAFALLTAALGGSQLASADDRAVFRLRDLERRFRDGGEYVARKLPPNAVVFTTQQSGSVRFYSGRPTIIWDMLDAAWLDRAVEHLSRARPAAILPLREGGGSRLPPALRINEPIGGLEWPPAALIGQEIKIFDPLDYERFRKGEKIETDYVFGR